MTMSVQPFPFAAPSPLPSASDPAVSGADVTTFSPDTLLAYCQTRLGDLDDQINGAMNQQQSAINERQAISQAMAALGKFNPGGPQTASDMNTCMTALDAALQSFPPGDPGGAQFQKAIVQMQTDYQYCPPGTLPPNEQLELDNDVKSSDPSTATRVNDLDKLQQSGQLLAAPTSDQWTATTSSFSNVSSDIQGQSEMNFLQMQDLVSQRQQAVELATGMLNKVDQTLEDQAKAVGQ
jgi:hypothetical protein